MAIEISDYYVWQICDRVLGAEAGRLGACIQNAQLLQTS